VKKDKLSTHKKKAWTQFSIYIRTRDCINSTGNIDRGFCVSCSKVFPFSSLQAGHFIDGRRNAVLFSELGVNSQCYACNISKHGNKIDYWQFMEGKHGREVINELILESHKTVIYKAWDYDQITEKYAKMTELLKGNL
jgi:hypothetical protein